MFCGSIFNKRRRQTKRQREASIKLRKDMDQLSAWVMELIRKPRASSNAASPSSFEGDEWIERQRTGDVIELSWACLAVAVSAEKERPKTRRVGDEVQSFSIVAASCLLKELDRVTKPTSMKGVRGGGVRVKPRQGKKLK